MRRTYLGFVTAALVLVVAMGAMALATGDVIEETKTLLLMPWGRFVLADVLASFLLLSTFVQLIERRIWVSVALFTIAALVLGSITYALWMLLRYHIILARIGSAKGE